MSVLAVVRTTEWEIPLFVHVLGAMVVVASVLLAATALQAASRSADVGAVRLGYRALLFVALPAWVVFRVSAQVTLSESGLPEDEAWIGIGFMTSEVAFVLMIVATVIAFRAARRDGAGATRAATVLAWLVLALFLVGTLAMTVKP